MIRFEEVREDGSHCLRVILDDKYPIGIISEYGFSFNKTLDQTDDIRIKNPSDLVVIAKKVDEVKKLGIVSCPSCGGTPFFKKMILDKEDPELFWSCTNRIHPD